MSTGCHRTAEAPKKKAVEVVTTRAITGEVCDFQDFSGRLDAYRTVNIRPRVTGYIVAAPFREGALVKKGQVVFVIDQDPYRADLLQAEANYKQALAEQNLQQKNAARAHNLYSSRAMGKEEYDQIQAAAEKASATVGAMEAARERARINFAYTEVRSPIDGRISRRVVDPGNLVNADQTLLTTVVAEEPVYAYFDVDERNYLKLVHAAEGIQSLSDQPPTEALRLPVLMRLANEDEFSQKGNINFLDNRLNETTGTIRMRGKFANPRHTLKAGLFIRIRLPLGTPYQPILIPDEAVQSDQGRKFVFVIEDKGDKTVAHYQAVEVGQLIHGMRVIKKGLKKSDRFIVEGMQKVREGAEVKVTSEKKLPPLPTPPLVKMLEEKPQQPGSAARQTESD